MTSKDGNGVAILNEEIAGEVAAFKRARLRAEALARATGTALKPPPVFLDTFLGRV